MPATAASNCGPKQHAALLLVEIRLDTRRWKQKVLATGVGVGGWVRGGRSRRRDCWGFTALHTFFDQVAKDTLFSPQATPASTSHTPPAAAVPSPLLSPASWSPPTTPKLRKASTSSTAPATPPPTTNGSSGLAVPTISLSCPSSPVLAPATLEAASVAEKQGIKKD